MSANRKEEGAEQKPQEIMGSPRIEVAELFKPPAACVLVSAIARVSFAYGTRVSVCKFVSVWAVYTREVWL